MPFEKKKKLGRINHRILHETKMRKKMERIQAKIFSERKKKDNNFLDIKKNLRKKSFFEIIFKILLKFTIFFSIFTITIAIYYIYF